jgi:oligosaccharyltransferase complex subunit beta
VPSSTSIVGFLSELDISLPVERTGTVIDHFNYDVRSAAESHDVLVVEGPINIRSGLKPYFEIEGGVVAFPHAVGHVLGSGPLLSPVVRASATAYSYNPKEQAEVLDADDLFAAGQQLSLLSVFQARNSARVTVLGSAELLQNKWFEAVVGKPGGNSFRTDNQEFAKRVSGWAFQELGVLRVNSIEHKLQDSDELNPGIYRIKNDVVSCA